MLVGVHHIAYVVADMDKAIRFVEEFMGLKLKRREMLTEFEMGEFRVGETIIELMRPVQADSQYTEFLRKTGGGLNHVAFTATDIEAQTERMKRGGVGFENIFVAETGWHVTNVDSSNVLGMRLQLAQKNDEEISNNK